MNWPNVAILIFCLAVWAVFFYWVVAPFLMWATS